MIFAPEALSRDGFLGGRLALMQPRTGYRAAIDPVLLAAFVPARPGERVLELGCGAGAASLCLATRVEALDLHGLEVQAAYAELARRNASDNALALTVHEGDLRAMPEAFRQAGFAQVLANPPYRPAASPASADAGRDRAQREGEASLAEWIDAGLRRLVPGGCLTLIHEAGRLGTILTELEGRAGAIEVLPVAPRSGEAAVRVLVRGRKGRSAALRLLPPLILHGEKGGGYAERAEAVLRAGAELT